MKNKQRQTLLLLFLPMLAVLVYNLPLVKSRLDWRLTEWRAELKYFLSPPEQVVFQPMQQANVQPTITEPRIQSAPSITTTLPQVTPTPGPSITAAVSALPTTTPTLLPQSIQLTGVRYERQGWNNCGPATLAMALSFWGWKGDQYKIAPLTKPNTQDKNVMPYEITDYVNSETDYRALSRAAGDLPLLKRLIASGFPVMIEKGFEGVKFDGWMGHYELITGYDDSSGRFTAQDSYMGRNLQLSYSVIESYWRAFNDTYIIVFPSDRENEVMAILGPQADEGYNRQYAAQKASDEISTLSGRDQFFALFNRGTSLVALLEYQEAAKAYDKAFALYPTIPEKERPWRMMWYQTGPYWAYYYTGRYQDVVDLATKTLENMSEPILEESFYWRGLAYEALEKREKAIQDFQTSLKVHTGFQPSVEQLKRLGIKVKSP